nr:ABC transporter permease [Sulfobacillus harzensis]
MARRLGQDILALFGIAVIIFFLLHIDTASPARAILGKTWTPAKGAALNARLGLNHPVPVQFMLWMKGLLSVGGVGSIITRALPPTLEILGLGMLIGAVFSVLLALAQTRHAGTLFDGAVSALVGILSAIPSFFLGFVLLFVFSVQIILFPASGLAPPHASLANWAWHEVLPVVTLALSVIGPWSRQLRSSAAELLHEEFIRTARAKGVPERRVVSRHVVRKALLPFITQLGLSFPTMINTIIAVEVIYGIPGAGTALLGALNGFFFAQATTVALVLAAVTITGSLLADLAYTLVDPRIQYR